MSSVPTTTKDNAVSQAIEVFRILCALPACGCFLSKQSIGRIHIFSMRCYRQSVMDLFPVLILLSGTPDYLSELCIPASSVNYRSHLRSAHQADLIVPRIRLARYGQRAFAYAAPCVWNSLPTDLKDYNLSLAVFKRRLKSYFLTRHNL